MSLDDTCRLPAPETDQPPAPAPAVALTVSVNATSIVSRETTLAAAILGARASSITTPNDPLPPAALPDASTSSVWFTVSVPVALVASTGSKSITCPDAGGPCTRVGWREPPGSRTSPVYAEGSLTTASLYST